MPLSVMAAQQRMSARPGRPIQGSCASLLPRAGPEPAPEPAPGPALRGSAASAWLAVGSGTLTRNAPGLSRSTGWAALAMVRLSRGSQRWFGNGQGGCGQQPTGIRSAARADREELGTVTVVATALVTATALLRAGWLLDRLPVALAEQRAVGVGRDEGQRWAECGVFEGHLPGRPGRGVAEHGRTAEACLVVPVAAVRITRHVDGLGRAAHPYVTGQSGGVAAEGGRGRRCVSASRGTRLGRCRAPDTPVVCGGPRRGEHSLQDVVDSIRDALRYGLMTARAWYGQALAGVGHDALKSDRCAVLAARGHGGIGGGHGYRGDGGRTEGEGCDVVGGRMAKVGLEQ